QDCLACKRFFDQLRSIREGLLAEQRIPGVTGDEDDLEARAHGAAFICQRPAGHRRHHDVRDEQIDLVLAGGEQIQRLRAVRGSDDAVSLGAEQKLERLLYRRLILDDQYSTRDVLPIRALAHRGFLGDWRVRARQEYPELGALSRSAHEFDVAAALLHDPVRCSETKSGSAPDFLRREEGLENLSL